MARLTKAQAKAHREAERLLDQDRLSEDDRWFIYENWQESAHHVNNLAGAFFTPMGLARDFSIEVDGDTIIDLCAGIGALSFAVLNRKCLCPPRIVCVEMNPDYVAIGKKLLPEATWVEANIFDLPAGLGHFDCAISNPPFGATPRTADRAPRYSGQAFEYHAIDIASDLADYGVFIIPQMSASFRYSGQRHYERAEGDQYRAFVKATGICLEPNCGIDTAFYERDWRGVAPKVEVVIADFSEAKAARAPSQPDMFTEAA